MQHRVSLFPQPGDQPGALMSGTAGDIPVLYLDRSYGGIEIAWHHDDDLDAGVAFFDHLADEASNLANLIRQRQRGLNQLLAAVEASPGGES